MFHFRDNIYFGRCEDGAVRIVKFSRSPHVCFWHDNDTAITHTTEHPRADGEFFSVEVVFDVRVPAEAWYSIISSVSKAGESNGGYAAAQTFHQQKDRQSNAWD